MGRPIKKFIRYHLLDAVKSNESCDNEETNNQSEVLLDDHTLEEETNIDRDQPNNSENTTNESFNSRNLKGTTYLESLMLFLKANIGSGVLAMPYGFKNSGLVFGSISLWFMGFICTACIHVLINSYKHVLVNMSPAYMNKKVNYEEVVYLVVKEKSRLNSKYPYYAKIFISIFLIISQFGCGCIYLVFIATNLKQVFDFYYPNSGLTIQTIMSIVLVPLILYFLIKDLKTLAFFSAVANFLMISSMFVILYDLCFSSDLKFKSVNELDLVAAPNNWPIFFSLALYAFEGIPLTMPVYNEMKYKSSFDSWNGVLNIGMILVAFMYFIIGLFGYLKYGKDVQASITLNLPITNILFQMIKVLYSLAIFISYNLQFSVASNTIWSYICNSFSSLKTHKKQNLIHSFFRSALVLVSFLFAICVPKIELFISLFGALSASTLAILIPAILDLILFWPLSKYSLAKLGKNVILILFGLYIFIVGCYVSVYDIVKYYTQQA